MSGKLLPSLSYEQNHPFLGLISCIFGGGHSSFDTHLRRLHRIGRRRTLRVKFNERGDERKGRTVKARTRKLCKCMRTLGVVLRERKLFCFQKMRGRPCGGGGGDTVVLSANALVVLSAMALSTKVLSAMAICTRAFFLPPFPPLLLDVSGPLFKLKQTINKISFTLHSLLVFQNYDGGSAVRALQCHFGVYLLIGSIDW